ncbi:MAG: ATP-binding protein [Patescibacteria group bacterium]
MQGLIPQLLISIPTAFMVGFGVWIFLRNPKSRINVSFLGLIMGMLLWSIPHIIIQNPNIDAEGIRFWINMNFIGPAVFFSYFVYFPYVFPEDKISISWKKAILILLLPVITVPAAFTQNICLYVSAPNGFMEWGIPFLIFYLMMPVYIIWGIRNFYWKIRGQRGSNRRAVFLVFFSLVSAVCLSAFFSSILPIFFGYEGLLFLGPGVGGMFFAILGSYAIVRYGLMDIRVIAKRALLYATVITVGTLFFGSVVLISDAMEENFPSLSFWFVPIAFSCAGLILGIYIWKVLSESEAIKYEFITTVTHKFRTPLSRIIWALEGIKEEGGLTDFQQSGLRSIDYSTRSILKMVDLMTHLSDERTSSTKKELNLSETLKATLNDTEAEFTRKNISLERDIEENITVFAEKSGLRFVVNALLENALTYTPSGGVVNVDLYIEDGKAVIRVKDTGIGMSKSTQESVSKSFFRGKEARTKDTEGMGVGLYVSRSIVDEIDGEIDFHSDGIGEGSTFFVRLPKVKRRKFFS